MSVGGLSFCAAAQLWHIIMNLSAKNQKSEGKKMWKLTPAQVKQRNKMEKQETERKSEKQQWKIREKLDDGMEKQRQSRKRMARKQCKTPNLEPVQCSLRCAFAAFRIKTGSLWLDIHFLVHFFTTVDGAVVSTSLFNRFALFLSHLLQVIRMHFFWFSPNPQ